MSSICGLLDGFFFFFLLIFLVGPQHISWVAAMLEGPLSFHLSHCLDVYNMYVSTVCHISLTKR